MNPRTGSTFGRYRVLSVLGRGGMGIVYRAVDDATGEEVAVKTVRIGDAAMLSGIRREIQALRRLDHPGIVAVKDSGSVEGMPWYAMELLDGIPLDELARRGAARADTLREVDRTAPLPRGAASGEAASAPPQPLQAECRNTPPFGPMLGILHGVCRTLAYLHGEGIVHRDLKPDNVIVCRPARPVLVDFGISRALAGVWSRESVDAAGEASGTVSYMAPEQAHGDLVDARADLYAVGCILYELVTGVPPFVAERPEQVVMMHLRAEHRPPSELASGVPPELDALVARLLQKEPRLRLGHADEVAEALVELGALAAEEPGAPPPRPVVYRPRLSGRDDVLESLAFGTARPGQERVAPVLLTGEAGAGKTRLLLELASVAARHGLDVLSGSCPAPGAGGAAPLEGLRQPLESLADQCRTARREEREAIFGGRAKILAPYAAGIASLPDFGVCPDPAELPPERARERLVDAVASTFAAAAAREPILLILDDVQWADGLTLDLLRQLATTVAWDAPGLQVVAALRSEEAPDLLAPVLRACREVRVGPLSRDDVASMAADILGVDDAPAPLVDHLAGASQGNPLFVSEQLREAIERGLLSRERGRWRVPADAETYRSLAMPRSIREIVTARLRGLGAEAQRVLAAAAVLGRDVDGSCVEHLAGAPQEEVDFGLSELERRAVLQEDGPSRFRFSHDLLREMSYEAIGTSERALLHRKAAELLSSRGAEPAVLGHHFERAGRLAEARSCYLEAARRAGVRYAHEDSVRLYAAYLALCPEPAPESIAARNDLGEALRLLGRGTDARAEHRRAIDEARALGDPGAECAGLMGVGRAAYEDGAQDDAERAFQEALRLSRSREIPKLEAMAVASLAAIALQRGQRAEAERLLWLALDLHGAAGNTRERIPTLVNLALLRRGEGRAAEALTLLREGEREAARTGDRRMEARSICDAGVALQELGKPAEALEHFERALAIAKAAGDLAIESSILNAIGTVHGELGHAALAMVSFREALDRSRRRGDVGNEALYLTNLAVAHEQKGDLAAAAACLEEGLAVARRVGSPTGEAGLLCRQGALAARGGDLDAALALFRRAAAIASSAGNTRDLSIFEIHVASVMRRKGDPGAYDLLRGARTRLELAGDKLQTGMCLCEEGLARLASREPASSELAAAERIARELGVGPESELARSIVELRNAMRGLPVDER
ncbi:MAG: tetratricopeptide repeat protein [Acidobacteriota bacterium]